MFLKVWACGLRLGKLVRGASGVGLHLLADDESDRFGQRCFAIPLGESTQPKAELQAAILALRAVRQDRRDLRTVLMASAYVADVLTKDLAKLLVKRRLTGNEPLKVLLWRETQSFCSLTVTACQPTMFSELARSNAQRAARRQQWSDSGLLVTCRK